MGHGCVGCDHEWGAGLRFILAFCLMFVLALPALADSTVCEAPPALQDAAAGDAFLDAAARDVGRMRSPDLIAVAPRRVAELAQRHGISEDRAAKAYAHGVCIKLAADGAERSELSRTMRQLASALRPMVDASSASLKDAAPGPREKAAALRASEAEAARIAAEEEARRRAEAEAARLAAEEEARRRAEAEAARLATEEDARRRAEAEAARLAAEEDARRRAEEEAARIAAEEEARRRAEAEAARLAAEEEAHRRAEEEATEAASSQPDDRSAEVAAPDAVDDAPAPGGARRLFSVPQSDTGAGTSNFVGFGPAEAPDALARRAAPDAGPAAASAQPPEDCVIRGVHGGQCLDVDAALERLSERPVEYNHPDQMIKDRPTEIMLVLRTDFAGEDLPPEISQAFEGLQGEVRQERAKISNFMSAQLRGRDFDIDPAGLQERSVTWREPVRWSWYVTPREAGEGQKLQLELYAHIVDASGQRQPPVLIKTLDATINVDVRTIDWLLAQVRTLEPVYGLLAALIGLITIILTLVLRRRREEPKPEAPGGPNLSPPASQQGQISAMTPGEAAAAAARRRADEQNGSPEDGSPKG